jgi:signal transduction histidine kinase
MGTDSATGPLVPHAARDKRSFAELVVRIPGRVRTKLLVAFLGIAGLLVLVALVGVSVLGRSNSRSEQLKALEHRAAGYGTLQSQASTVRDIFGLCSGGTGFGKGQQGGPYGEGHISTNDCLRSITLVVGIALADLGSAMQLDFAPTEGELPYLQRIRRDFATLQRVSSELVRSNKLSLGLHRRAENLADDLNTSALALASGTSNRASTLAARNRSSYVGSRDFLIGAAAGSVVLALLLGLLLSSALIGPLQRIGVRLAGIAGGDFAGRVEVASRDELGTLATNVNRMSDELQRLYRELELASEHKSQFLANMSHELRTPLNAIIGFSEVLHEQMFGELNERQLAYVEDVLEAGRHLLSLINDVLDLAKIEAGRMELDLSEFALQDVLRSAVSMHAERASRGGIELTLSTEPAEIDVTADARRVRQVVFNLVSNAVKFTPSEGRVDISARVEDGHVEVAVRDTGHGIAAADLETIFEEFEQTSEGKQAEGTGLGLPLSRRLVELHGGRLWAESAPGRGSTFHFTLPIRREVSWAS